MLLKVVPAFHEIFYAFDVDLPSITQWIFDVSQWFNTWFWLLIPVKLFLLPVCVVAALYYIGVLRWEPWPIRAFTRPFHRATVLLALARTAEAGRPLTKTFQLLAQWYPQPAIRNRLGRVAKQVDQGQSWVRAMRSTRLLSASDAGVLHAAERVGNLPWAMREMAERNHRRLEAAASVLNNVILPLVLLAYALPAAVIVIGLFVPIIHLIQALV